MITNFEEITADLTAEEKKLLPILINGFKFHDKSDPIKEPAIVKLINDQREKYHLTKKFSGARFRKLCNLIRTKSILPLIATSNGYYVSSDPEEIRKQIQSLTERAESILSSANGLKNFIKQS